MVENTGMNASLNIFILYISLYALLFIYYILYISQKSIVGIVNYPLSVTKTNKSKTTTTKKLQRTKKVTGRLEEPSRRV